MMQIYLNGRVPDGEPHPVFGDLMVCRKHVLHYYISPLIATPTAPTCHIAFSQKLGSHQMVGLRCPSIGGNGVHVTVQITFIFIDFRVCYFAFAFKTQNAPCVSRFKRVLFSDRFQFAF